MSPREFAHRVFRFGDFALDLDRETLYHGEHEIHLRPKAFAVLRLLLENRGQLVTKTDLHDAVWEGSFVTDDSLAHCVADIRRALGDGGFELIRTVPRRGYVFDHAVMCEMAEPIDPPSNRKPRRYRLGAVAAVLAGAVLLGFGAGQSSNIQDVPPPDPVELAAAAALEGTRTTTSIAAENLYEQARFFYNRRAEGDLAHAEDHYRAALEQDSSFADAWIGLAGIYAVRFGQGELALEEVLPLLGDATRHALTLAPGNAQAHLRRATYYRLRGDDLLAWQHTETALALGPDDVLILGRLAGQLAFHGRFDEAIDIQYRAVQADPTSALQYHNLVWFLLAADRTTAAAVEAQEYRALKPEGADEANSLIADVMILQGNFEQALIVALNMASGSVRDRNLAIIYYALGQHEQADQALGRLIEQDDKVTGVHIAEVFALRGDIDSATEWLVGVLDSSEDAAVNEQTWRLLSPYLLELRSDGRWQSLYANARKAHDASFLLTAADRRQRLATN